MNSKNALIWVFRKQFCQCFKNQAGWLALVPLVTLFSRDKPDKRKLKYPPKNDAKCWRSQVFKYFDVIELFRRKDFKSFVGHRYVITMNVLTFKCQLIHQETRSDVNKFIKKPDIYGQSSSSCRWNLWSVITKLNNTFEPLKHKVTFYKFESLISSKQEWIQQMKKH